MGNPVRAVLSVALGGLIVVFLLFTGLGLLIKNYLGALSRWDNDVNTWLVEHRTSRLNDWTHTATGVADTLGILVVLVLAIVVLLLVRRRWAALFLGLALALELISFLSVNFVVDRPRPDVVRLGTLPSTSSFPSGHTAAVVALYGGLALILSDRFRFWVVQFIVWLVAVLATAAIGYGRVYRGMHHPSDAIAGVLLGIAVLCVASFAVRAGQLAIDKRNDSPENGKQQSLFSEVVR
ncbi:MAG: phosphatase PAP2 family protein [Ilumatobacteraceae bacterium]